MSYDPHSDFPQALARQALADVTECGAPIVILGIAGLQGSGKSTLAAQIVDEAQRNGWPAATVSSDDFYSTRTQRLQLARSIHPLLITRGPPGTHDLPLALETLDAVRAGAMPPLPRFDKLLDDRTPSSQWLHLTAPLKLLVLEGCFLKTPPEPARSLRTPCNALEREEDPQGIWRRWCNRALAEDYPALWRCIDFLWWLHPPRFEIVSQWRWQQEQRLHALYPDKRSMSQIQVERFVQHFERVGRQSIACLPTIADRVVHLDANRRVRKPHNGIADER